MHIMPISKVSGEAEAGMRVGGKDLSVVLEHRSFPHWMGPDPPHTIEC